MTSRTLEANADYLRRLYKIGFRLKKQNKTHKAVLTTANILLFFFFRLNDQKRLTLDEALTITHDAAAL